MPLRESSACASTEVQLLSNYGSALLLIANDPHIRIREMAASLGVSERSAHSIVADLERSGYLARRREGRRNSYTLAPTREVVMPAGPERNLGTFLGALSPVCAPTVESSFDDVFAASWIPTAVIGGDGLVRRVNAAACALLARPERELLARSWSDFTLAEDVEQWRETVLDVLNGREVRFAQRRLVRSDGSHVWVSLNVSMEPTSDGTSVNLLIHVPDITDQKRLEEQVDSFNFYDALTGLANRTLLRERLAETLVDARATGLTVGVITLRLEHFRHLYATLGDNRADELMRRVAIRLATTIGERDIAGRLSDDVFAVQCCDLSGDESGVVAQSLWHAFRAPFVIGERQVSVVVSIGVTVATSGSEVDQLLRDSAVAADRAHDHGGKLVVFSDAALGRTAQRRSDLIAGLFSALSGGELSVHFQPIVEISSSRIIGAEALLRWRHPEWGDVGPAEFIPLAEELGLIGEMGEWVLREALAQVARWDALGATLYVAVNVSVQQVLTTDLVSVVSRALEDTDLPGTRLVLELTESVLMEDERFFSSIATELKELGVSLAIDDFGTGFSSLGRLRDLPVDELKIDRGFIRGLGIDSRDSTLVETIIAMARSLRLSVTAEGIETESQLDYLRTLDCQRGQGYLFGRPVDGQSFERLLTERTSAVA